MSICSDDLMLLTVDHDDKTIGSSANYRFCKELLNWVFQESGVLRASNLRHNKSGEKCEDGKKCPNPENYQLEDNVEFYIKLEQKTEGQWAPFIANDVQLQFVMLNPYYRVTLQRDLNTYSYKFRVPERLGVFRFVVDYTRYGLSFLDEQNEVTVIQWRHDAYPRNVTRAYPFYFSVMSLMAGFFIFIVAFLFSEYKKVKTQTQKKGDKSE